MTNNDQFKTEATALLDSVMKFQRKYFGYKRVPVSNALAFENDLRMMLMVARTDEENKQQREADARC